MPIIIGVFCLLPLLIGFIGQYAVCRFTRGKLWKLAPAAAVIVLAALVAAGRMRIWQAEHSPLTQLLFVPVLPALFLLLGLLFGWRLWKRLWSPRIVRDRREN